MQHTPLVHAKSRSGASWHKAAVLAFGAFAWMVMGASSLRAQTDSTATVRGSIRTAAGAPIADALVLIEQDGATVSRARTLDAGNFTIPRLLPGSYTLVVKRLGYTSDRQELTVGRGVTRVTSELAELPRLMAPAESEDAATGVAGVVGDFARMEPLTGVSVSLVGGDEPVSTDANGRFVLPAKFPGPGAIRVEREGFEPRLISYSVDEGDRVELSVLLDSGKVSNNSKWIWRDLDQRAKWRTPRTVRVPRDELVASQTSNLLVALEQSESVQNSGLILTRAACVFVDGQPRPGFPIDAIRADKVEFVEAYAARTDLSRTLTLRWPPNGSCGAAGGDIAARRAIETGQGVQFVAVWLR